MEAEAAIPELNRLFILALKRLGEAGETEAACRLAAQGWSLLRSEQPQDAQRLNGVLHYLTRPNIPDRKREKK
jgi:hypothetical protein